MEVRQITNKITKHFAEMQGAFLLGAGVESPTKKATESGQAWNPYQKATEKDKQMS